MVLKVEKRAGSAKVKMTTATPSLTQAEYSSSLQDPLFTTSKVRDIREFPERVYFVKVWSSIEESPQNSRKLTEMKISC